MATLTTAPDSFAARIFFDGKGVEVHEPYKGKDGEIKHRKFTAWFNAPVEFEIGATGEFAGSFSSKIDKWTNPDGSPKLDFEGNPGQSVVVQINDATFTSSKPAPTAKPVITDDTPF
jgi:hypothetical protein